MTVESEQIKRLLNDPHLQTAFENVRMALLEKFTQCSTADAETMVDIRKRLHLLDSVKANLYQAIEDGELEDFRAQQDERPPILGDLLAWKRKV